jgi:hypothetical protein
MPSSVLSVSRELAKTPFKIPTFGKVRLTPRRDLFKTDELAGASPFHKRSMPRSQNTF